MISTELARHAAAAVACLVLAGCSLSPVPKPTEPSGVTQQLMMRSLERALAKLDLEALQSRAVRVEVFHHGGPEALDQELIVAWLGAQGVRTVATSPDLKAQS